MAISVTQILTAQSLTQDPALEVITLQNGMRVAFMKNTEPPKRVSMRLLVKRGSMHETDAERGLAHFLEHMAFNGTKHYPDGKMVEYFQRLGMGFGADTNAHTSFNETVYKLDMPNSSEKLMSDGMLLLRDYCDGMLLSQNQIDRERGVIVAEMKSRDTNDYRRTVKEIAHYFKGSKFADRMPIGLESIVKNADRETFVNFYKATYRPENTVLVVVGDTNSKQIFELAKKYFSDFQGDKNITLRKDEFGKLEKSTTSKNIINGDVPNLDAMYHSDANAPKSFAAITLSRELPKEDTIDVRIEEYRMRAILGAITARYLRVAETPNSPLTSGSATEFDFSKFCRTIIFSAESPVSKSSEALIENFRQILDSATITNAELATSKKKIIDGIESEIASKTTQQSRALANAIVASFSDEYVFTSPETDLEIAKKAFDSFTAEDAIKLLKEKFTGANLKVFVSDTAKEFSQAELDKIVNSALLSAKTSLREPSFFEPSALEFSNFEGIGKVKSENTIADLKINSYEFDNGVRLNIKQTDFRKDEVRMIVSFGNGVLDLPKDKPEYYSAIYALLSGGTKFQSAAEISAAQYSMKMSVTPIISGNEFRLVCGSTKKDFLPMIRLAATMIADAGFRQDGEDSFKKFGEAFYRDFETNPNAQMMFSTFKLFGKDLAKIPGKLEDFEKIKMSDVATWLQPILKNSYMEISIVGDISTQDAFDAIAKTFGTLTKRTSTKAEPFASLIPEPPSSKIKLFYITENEPRSIALKLWQSCGRQDVKEMRVANVLSNVLDDILRKDIREAQGKVYSPFAFNNSSVWIKNFGVLAAGSVVAPEYNEEILSLTQKCADKVSINITDDEFERAKAPLLKEVEANLRKNAYWLDAVLNLSQAKPVNIELARTISSGYEGVSIDDVKNYSKKILTKKPYEISIEPKTIDKRTQSAKKD